MTDPTPTARIAELNSAIQKQEQLIDHLTARIAELESAVAYTDGRNPVTGAVELQQRIRELEAELAEDAVCPYCELLAETQQRIRELEAQLADMPRWTRITDDPATWPQQTCLVWTIYIPEWESHIRVSHPGADDPKHGDYWFPITPPEADNA